MVTIHIKQFCRKGLANQEEKGIGQRIIFWYQIFIQVRFEETWNIIENIAKNPTKKLVSLRWELGKTG